MLYSAVDDEVTHYDVDVEAATLTPRSSIRVPSFVQEGWAHPSRKHLYLTTSNRGPGLKDWPKWGHWPEWPEWGQVLPFVSRSLMIRLTRDTDNPNAPAMAVCV